MRYWLGFVALVLAQPALAHQAASGWTYPYYCCSDGHCAQAQTTELDGQLALTSPIHGVYEVSKASHKLPSPDSNWHLCATTNSELKSRQVTTPRVYCVFQPAFY